ncbi:hypothetical protein B9Z55_004328 [Caenorhabditis nigoni]|uniref:NOT2/NOT3/NOT5 C-terminal domain-containing protein n=1 Tax=Caenorhabditis nigoni TaxID=1611254 RepID=A0A2G5UWC9_9PELO|nr:hypothetical protein B9Z55_004328 [Caenorhabditis nigoni]
MAKKPNGKWEDDAADAWNGMRHMYEAVGQQNHHQLAFPLEDEVIPAHQPQGPAPLVAPEEDSEGSRRPAPQAANIDEKTLNEHPEGVGIQLGSQEDTLHGIETHPDGEVTNIPVSMLDDRFGMAGLVAYLRTVDNPSIIRELGLTTTEDGTQVGSNCGPWAKSSIRSKVLDVEVPEQLLTQGHIDEKLPMRLEIVPVRVLFHLFYNCPNEIYQVAAACELYHRKWLFRKSGQVWLTRSEYGGAREQTGTYEKGYFNVFYPQNMQLTWKEETLDYTDLESPKLPQAVAGNAGQQQLGGVPGGNGGAPGPAPMQMQPKNKMMKSDPTLTNSEFQRQKEDSHALPGVDGSMVEDQLETMRCSNCNELINIPVFEAHTKKCKKQ